MKVEKYFPPRYNHRHLFDSSLSALFRPLPFAVIEESRLRTIEYAIAPQPHVCWSNTERTKLIAPQTDTTRTTAHCEVCGVWVLCMQN